MTKSIEYACKKRINDLEEIDKIVNDFKETFPMQGKDAVYALYHMMGMEIDYEDIPL